MYWFILFRDRKYAESKDLFTECGKIDDQEMKRDMQSGVDDPTVNITEFEDKTLDEGYGTTNKSLNTSGTVSQAMIKRFNQHSIMVLKTTKNKSSEAISQNGTDLAKQTAKQNGLSENKGRNEDGHVNKKQKILEKITYDDLEDSCDTNKTSITHLNLSKVRREFLCCFLYI